MKDDLIGKHLGQFEIIEEIGRGGMATVYRARQTSINRIVAIKVLPGSLLHDPTFYERFTREVDVVAHLEHPHILPIYDYGDADGMPYIAMRYLAGGSMAQWIRRGLPPLDRLVKPVTQIAAALDYAHQQGIIHRDLKPGNILLDEAGNAYLSDFGIARVLDSNLTGSAIIGTPAYMSPEQANALPLDARSDIYSFGIVLFELITGRGPFEAETPVALLLKHINEPIPSARSLRSELPLAAEHVIAKATAKRPDDRYPSASDLAEAFAAAMRHHVATPATMVDDGMPTLIEPGINPRTETIHPTPLASAQAATPTIAPPPAARRVSPLIALLALVLVAAVIGVGFILTRPQPGTVVTPAPIPTPFAQAYTVRRTTYSISVPNDWTFTDLSAELGLVHVWQLDARAYVALWLIKKSDLPDIPANADFSTLVDTFDQQVLRGQDAGQPALHFIDSAVADDGSIRRSYQFLGMEGSQFPPGQTDNFYLDRGDTIALVQMYAAYSMGNDLVPTFQSILDSVRVLPPPAA